MAGLRVRRLGRGRLALGVLWTLAGAGAIALLPSSRFLAGAVADAFLSPRARQRKPDGVPLSSGALGLAAIVIASRSAQHRLLRRRWGKRNVPVHRRSATISRSLGAQGKTGLGAIASAFFFGGMLGEELVVDLDDGLEADLDEEIEVDEDESSACAPFLGSARGAKEAGIHLPREYLA